MSRKASPAGTPPAIVAQINKDVNAALMSPEFKEYFGSRGFTLGGSSADEFKAFIATEVKKWAGIVKAAGVKMD